METVNCTCKKCGAALGECANLWTQIGRTYFSPIIEPPDGHVVGLYGSVRLGERGTLVEACQLQDIACVQCHVVLGTKCLRSPTNHVLDENQVLLRATSVLLVSAEDGTEVDFVVKRYLKLREPSRTGSEASTATANGDRPHDARIPGDEGAPYGYAPAAVQELVDISQLQADLDAQRSDIDRIDNAGFKVVSTLAEAVSRVESDLAKMRHTLSELEQENRASRDHKSSLELEIKSVKRLAQGHAAIDQLQVNLDSANRSITEAQHKMEDATTELHRDLAHVRSEIRETREAIEKLRTLVGGNVPRRDHDKEMATIRAELAQLRNQMGGSRSKSTEPFPSRELDILTSNIAKIGNRASQVEQLQMEFEIFKGRVERMESARRARPSLHNGGEAISPYDSYDDDDDEYCDGDALAARRKRRSLGLDVSSTPGSNATKRTAYVSQVVDKPAAPGPVPNPESVVPRSGNARLTKAGKVDRRSTKRASARPAITALAEGKAAAGRRRRRAVLPQS